MKGKRLEEIKNRLAGIQTNYDVQRYVSTNDADELICISKELAKGVKDLKIEIASLTSQLESIKMETEKLRADNKKFVHDRWKARQKSGRI